MTSSDSVTAEQLDSVGRAFLTEMQACVRASDFPRARTLFDPNVIAFGTYTAILTGRDQLESDQWRNVWPRIRDFTFRLDEARCIGDADVVCVVVPWDSTGAGADDEAFPRPGRATLVLMRR